MILSNTTRNYEWDHSDRMRAYYNQTGTSEPTVYAQYLYDAGGTRVKKLVRTQGGDYESVTYVDEVFEYHKKESGANTYEKNYSHIMDDKSRICMIRTGSFPVDPADTTFYILEDHLGSSNVRLDTNGSVIDKEEYYPFGDSSLRTWSKKRYRFCGKEKDSESGLYYYGMRYYAAWTCRFLSVDPLVHDFPSWTPYHYCHANPLNMIDPTGMSANPVYGSDGTYKGNTKEGFTGEVIIYDGDKDFSGMSASELLYNESFNVKTQKGEANTYDKVRNELTGDAKSKIWTHIASKMEGQQIYDETFSMSDLTGGKIYFDATINGNWESSYALGKGKGKISGSDKYSYETTVENIQSSIGVHEYYSHIKKNQGYRYSSHRLAYKNVINYKTLWNKTTDAYKGFNMRALLKYTKSETGRTRVDPLYRNLYKKYKDKR